MHPLDRHSSKEDKSGKICSDFIHPILTFHLLSFLISALIPVSIASANSSTSNSLSCESIYQSKTSEGWNLCVGMMHGLELANCDSLVNPTQKDSCVSAMIAQDPTADCDEISSEHLHSIERVKNICHGLKVLKEHRTTYASSLSNLEWQLNQKFGQKSFVKSPEFQAFTKGFISTVKDNNSDHENRDPLFDSEASVQALIKKQDLSGLSRDLFLLGIAFRGLDELHPSETVIPTSDKMNFNNQQELRQHVEVLQKQMQTFLKLERNEPSHCLSDLVQKYGISRARTDVRNIKDILKSGYLLPKADRDPSITRDQYTSAIFFSLHHGDTSSCGTEGSVWGMGSTLLLDPKVLDLDPDSYISHQWVGGEYRYTSGSATKDDPRRYSKHLNQIRETNKCYPHEVTIRKPVSLDYVKEIIVTPKVYKSLEGDPNLTEAFKKYKDKIVIRKRNNPYEEQKKQYMESILKSGMDPKEAQTQVDQMFNDMIKSFEESEQ